MSFEKAVLDKVKIIESLLVGNFGASGKGLHEKLSSVENFIDSHFVKKIRRVATIRNKLFHEADFIYDQDPNVLLLDCDYIIGYLNIAIQNQPKSSSSQPEESYDSSYSSFFPQTAKQVVPLSEISADEEETIVRSKSVNSDASTSRKNNVSPLILRNGDIIKSIDELMKFAQTHPNTVKGESRAIATWLETLDYSRGESLDIQLNMHFSAMGIKPEQITSEMMPDFSKSLGKFTQFEGEVPPPPDKAKVGDVWIHPVDRSEMLFVPAGKFVMGYPKEKLTIILKRLGVPDENIPNFFDETPARMVFLDAYWIDKYPITNAQFADFIEDAKPNPPPESAWRYPHIVQHARSGGGDYPIHDISFFEALSYCDWVGKILPIEAQWEKAARGDKDDRILPWNGEFNLNWMNTIESSQPFPDGVEVQKNKENVSPYGCVQMLGNVEEWCLDAYDPDYYSVPNNTYNPTGSETSRNSVVVRGGSTAKPLAFARTSARNHCPPNKQGEFIGFRCVWTYGFTRNWSSQLKNG